MSLLTRSTRLRLFALMVLLLQSSAFGAAAVLDPVVAARASTSVAHVEEHAGATCVAHDEATCQLCRVGSSTLLSTVPPLSLAIARRAERPAANVRAQVALTARTALHSRAPPPA
jgi:hypothetical protein